MINIVFGANFLLGLLIILGVLILYFLRSVRPELSRDEDIFFTTLGLIYGAIWIVRVASSSSIAKTDDVPKFSKETIIKLVKNFLNIINEIYKIS